MAGNASSPVAVVMPCGCSNICRIFLLCYCWLFFINHVFSLSLSLSLDYKPFKCEECGKEFTKGYLLKKHQEVHVNERRFRCGECGKLYKTIAHVKGHRRVHSDERPYSCPKCGKRYKTKVCLPHNRLAFRFSFPEPGFGRS